MGRERGGEEVKESVTQVIHKCRRREKRQGESESGGHTK